MHISEDIKIQILAASENKLIEVISDFTTLQKSGVGYVGTCPCCKSERTLTVTPSKNIFKCFRCNNLTGKRPVDYLMKGQNKTYPEALDYLARKFNIFIPEDAPKPTRKPEKIKNIGKVPQKLKDSYCARMLVDSGLNYEDVKIKVFKSDTNRTETEALTFKPGTFVNGKLTESGDDVIISYYDLDGNPITYEQKDARGHLTGKMVEYYRIRWQFPDEHLDKNGKPYKYKSPVGSATYIYIPDLIRAAVRSKQKISRLFIQEGEKKAEKASKHGIMSVGISGIQNLGSGGRLPEDLIRIIQDCEVEEVCFILDGDWSDLSSSLRVTDRVDSRPRAFFSAVRNYKEYMRTLKNRNLYVEIYFGYVLPNEKKDKGIDDLLTKTLRGKEDDLANDINFLINEKNLKGKYIQMHKITTWTDHKLEEIWYLNNPKVFAEHHMDALKDLPEFRIGKHKWRINEKGELESAQPIESDEQFWDEIERFDKSNNSKMVMEFKYVRSRRFLENRGFGRHRLPGGGDLLPKFDYIHVNPPIVQTVDYWEIQDYIFEFAEANCKEEVNEMLSRGITQYLGPDKLKQLAFIEPYFHKPEREKQLFYFAENCWEISSDAIKELDYSQITHLIWADYKKKIPAKKVEPLFSVKKENGKFSFRMNKTGEGCDFLQFLINTSNFTWRNEAKQKLDNTVIVPEEELYENTEHLIAKLCAIGFMLMECKDRSCSKAVVAMDGRQSEVGASNGRSGKSIVGELFKNVMPTVYINGKKPDFATDTFLWDELTEKTKSVFIDDVRPGFDFESLFANITGDWAVNYKGGRRCTFPFSKSPKIYITTNHALNGEGTSFKDREWLIAFSDFYNDQHKPKDDFGCMFFDEWDFDQWNLTWNLMASCVQLYLKYGVVESPGERLEARILRQFMGEEFISWAEEYFSETSKRNNRISRKDLFDNFLDYAPDQRKWCKPTLFKKRIVKYCEWKGWQFNPHRYDQITGLPMFCDKDGKPDPDDKSGGIEYFTIGDDDFTSRGGIDVLNQDLFTAGQEKTEPF